jgi:cyclopropane-fatty-acyl-phospholipid synthase
MLERFVLTILGQFIQFGQLTITTPSGRQVCLGDADNGPRAAITVHDHATLRRLVTCPDLEFGEAYMDGRLTPGAGGLEPLMDLILKNSQTWAGHWAGRLTLVFGNMLSVFRHLNQPHRARRNVAHHYDLTDELFETFLDPWRQYSCAYFHHVDDTLEAAQITKLARIAAKLNLQNDHHVLDIGCGWGGLARALALCRKNVRVRGITLSERQLAHARLAAEHAGMTDQLDFQLRDYRYQSGSFDRVVSVGMLEHVGPRNYAAYFDKIADLLAPGGVALVHSIAVHRRARPVNRWLTRYIFPGGYLPSLQQLVQASSGRGWKLLDLEVMRGHYADTLRHWRHRFLANRDRMEQLHDDRFVRMWEFYLLGCEYFFRSQNGMIVQLLLSDDHLAVPDSRAYLHDLETAFRNILCQNSPSGNKRHSAS